MIASKYKANYCHYACFPPEIRKIISKSGSWINNHLFTYTPYKHGLLISLLCGPLRSPVPRIKEAVRIRREEQVLNREQSRVRPLS